MWLLALAWCCLRLSSPQALPSPSGSQAAASGLCPDQCILKANGNNVMSDGAPEVPEHLQAFRSHWEEALGCPSLWLPVFPLLSLGLQLSPHEDSPAVSLTEDSVHLEQGMVRECMSTAGVQCLVLEKVLEPCGSSASPPRSRWAVSSPEGCSRLLPTS
ncbi:Phosphatidylinositol 3; 4; 5-trisphosphate-dependent Rac exchanger 1 protein [Camelus dromedarius]|uniref:Phosphatidylinositol 3 n=1 Tax=Camelus dromedarius TaxID=9838 RepID=A0A5N4CCB0_CAMDR|nr:Phosphatidylinositol 3; 4; 5-trisphosphate-dependent Rac exchanger 1 protein [Camelus dromedarius]